MLATLSIALAMVMALSRPLFAANDELQTASIDTPASVAGTQSAADPRALPIATSIDLGDVYDSPSTVDVLPRISSGEAAMQREAALIASKEATWEPVQFLLSAEEILRHPNTTRRVLEVDIPPATATRLIWKPSRTFSGCLLYTSDAADERG